MANQNGDLGRCLLQTLQLRVTALVKIVAVQQVFRRIAGERQLGEHDQIGSRLLLLLHGLQHAFGVAFNVTDQQIQLGQCDGK
ncbi:Uncharacterised protein [Serratia quinivorans]|nr:Uncharacterised protein [Serratia quinivorans]